MKRSQEKTECEAKTRKEMDDRSENTGLLLTTSRIKQHYERKIKPDLQLFLWNRYGPKKDKSPILKDIVESLEFSMQELGKGSYGEVILVNKKGWKKPVAIKKQNCTRVFNTELQLLRKMNQISKNYPFLGSLFDAYKDLSRSCVLVLPVADGSLDKMPKNLLDQNTESIVMQGITGVFFFHTYIDSLHCDAHNGNWFYFEENFKGLKIKGFKIPTANVKLALFDPGLGIAITDKKPKIKEREHYCTSPIFDYFRFFSKHAGLFKYTDMDIVKACFEYFLHYNKNLKSRGKDWDYRFPNVKSETIWKDLMTIVSKKMSVNEVQEKWPGQI